MKYSAIALVAMLSLAGCATTSDFGGSASPAWSDQAVCERNGGWWHASMNYCEYQSPGFPMLPRR
jgi:hypothetical protein